jgi:hypothetical protein
MSSARSTASRSKGSRSSSGRTRQASWYGARCERGRALRSLGFDVPLWTQPPLPRPLAPMLARFVEYRLKHGGISPSTVPDDVRYPYEFISFLRKRGRRPDAARIVDIDEFVAACRSRMKRRTVACVCSSIRAFLRFRFAVGRLRHDLASSVVGPPLDRSPSARVAVEGCPASAARDRRTRSPRSPRLRVRSRSRIRGICPAARA